MNVSNCVDQYGQGYYRKSLIVSSCLLARRERRALGKDAERKKGDRGERAGNRVPRSPTVRRKGEISHFSTVQARVRSGYEICARGDGKEEKDRDGEGKDWQIVSRKVLRGRFCNIFRRILLIACDVVYLTLT